MKILTFLLLSLLLGCSQTKDIPKDKMDPALAAKLSELKQNSSDETIDFIGKCNSEISSAMKDVLETSGINLHSVSKDIFTATGNYKAIIKIAGKDFIKWLELPKTTYPLKNN